MSAPEPGGMPPPQPAATNHLPAMQLSFTADGKPVYRPVNCSSTPPPFAVRSAGNGNGALVTGDGINVNMGMGSGGGGGGFGINVNMGIGSGGGGGGGGDGGSIGGEQAKKRRGRPRKYGSDGPMPVSMNSTPPVVGGFLSPHPPPQLQQQKTLQSQPQQPQQLQGVMPGGGGPGSPVKRRGRPPGSSNKKPRQSQQQQPQQPQQPQQQQPQQPQHPQQPKDDPLGVPGIGFTPHIIEVNTGEDISSKIMSFSQKGPRAVCIISAIGTIQSVTLRQAATSGGSVTYEGRYEILSLTGSFMLLENGGGRSRSGGLSVSLAGPDGVVVGGGVAGLLIAASPVLVVVASFIADGRKELKVPPVQKEPLFKSSRPHSVTGQQRANSPPSHGTLSESSDGPGSPLHQSVAAVNSTPPGMSNLPWK